MAIRSDVKIVIRNINQLIASIEIRDLPKEEEKPKRKIVRKKKLADTLTPGQSDR